MNPSDCDINVKRRNKKNSKEALTELISFRVSDPLHKKLRQTLHDRDKNMGEYLRGLIEKDVKCKQKST